MEFKFTQKQAAEITGVKDGTIQVWARDGLIVPSIANPTGRGSSRLYSPADLVHLSVIKILSDMSFNRSFISSLAHHMDQRVTFAIPSDDRIPKEGMSSKDIWFDPFEPLGEVTDVLAVTKNHLTMWGFSATAGQMLGWKSPTAGQMPERDAVLIINLASIKERIRKAIE